MPNTYDRSLPTARHSAALGFRADVLAGLAATPKSLPCKYLYDERGAALFERICETPEYYPTRTELRILEEAGGDIARLVDEPVDVVELGSCNPRKFLTLLRHLRGVHSYVPVDIAATPLREGTGTLRRELRELAVRPVCADFTSLTALPTPLGRGRRVLLFFAGSTIGNFEPAAAVRLLGRLSRLVERPQLLIGVDVPKDRARLEAAYDDAAGVTAAFDLNLLERINRELGAGFDLRRFRHVARYDEAARRVEMHLESLVAQDVPVAERVVRFGAGERIHTESSYKYPPEEFRRLARAAGLRPVGCWQDAERLFSVHLVEREPRSLGRGAAGEATWP